MRISPVKLKLVCPLFQPFQDPHSERQPRQQSAPCCHTRCNGSDRGWGSCQKHDQMWIILSINMHFIQVLHQNTCFPFLLYLGRWVSVHSSNCHDDHRSAAHVPLMSNPDCMWRSTVSWTLAHCWSSWYHRFQEPRATGISLLWEKTARI